LYSQPATVTPSKGLDPAVAQWATTFNAIVDWHTSIDKAPLYTVTVEQALLRSDNRPLLLTEMIVEDVQRTVDQYVVHFGSQFPSEPSHDIKYALVCSAETTRDLLARVEPDSAPELQPAYNVIAAIRVVDKVSSEFPVVRREDDHFSIELEPKNRFVVQGECVAVRPL
jgi:hypothetical protein